ncbi:MAG: hypothetical protein IJC74_00505 [Clostridia bacterium]|nr:hypothetical protein [Clostridia bacterium]
MKKIYYKFEDMPYMLAYPEGYKKGDICPILFLIHGAGTRGTDPAILDNELELNDKYTDQTLYG